MRYAYATYGARTLTHAHTRFRRSQLISTVCVYHFCPSGCVGTPHGLKHAVGHGLTRIADFGYFAQSAGNVSIRVPV